MVETYESHCEEEIKWSSEEDSGLRKFWMRGVGMGTGGIKQGED